MVADATGGGMGPGVPPQCCWRCGVPFAQTDEDVLRRCTELALYYRNPCHGPRGCWVLTADGENPPPEIHLCPCRTGAA